MSFHLLLVGKHSLRINAYFKSEKSLNLKKHVLIYTDVINLLEPASLSIPMVNSKPLTELMVMCC